MRIWCLFLVLVISRPVLAVDKNGNYAIWGFGSSSCIKYTTARADDNTDGYRYYLMGYLTSYNHMAEETYSISNIMTMDEILNWLDGECELKPTNSFDQAVVQFIIEHNDKRMKYPPGGFGR